MQKEVGRRSNYWSNTILLPDSRSRNYFLEDSNQEDSNQKGMEFANTLPTCRECQSDEIEDVKRLVARLVKLLQ